MVTLLAKGDVSMLSKITEQLKQKLIADLNERVEDQIIERTNADLLVKLIQKADTADEAVSIAELGTTYKRTGFHFDKRLDKVQTSDTIRYLKKNEALSFTDGFDKPHNKLIIGDNYDALQNLLIEYKHSIDVIYIDPPYAMDDKGEYAQTNYENAITRDNLLSMLYPRLILARELLTEEGVIFCSIDDRNQAYVKGLFDEVFGERNFIMCFAVIRAEGGGMAKQVIKGHDYCLAYARNIQNFVPLAKEKDVRGKIIERNGHKYWIQEDWLRKEFGKYGNCHYEELIEYKGDEFKRKIDEGIKEGDYVLIPKDNGLHVIGKLRDLEKDSSKFYSVLKHLNKDGVNEIAELGLNFDYPKPVSLVEELVRGATFFNPNAIILDFFAGSGTTGQAVLAVNKEDDGDRQFILCTNNEITDTTPNGIALDVTTKRMKRVMTGSCYDGTSDFPWIKDHESLGGSLDVYDIGEVANFENNEGKTPFDVIDETAYDKEFDNIEDKINWVCENFDRTQKTLGGED